MIGLGVRTNKLRGGGTGSPPANTVAPSIPTTIVVDAAITISAGTWTNTPTSYNYKLYRGVTLIDEQNSASTTVNYTPVQADAGQNIKAVVTATNAGGSASADSNTVAQVLDADANTFFTAMALTDSTIIAAENNFFISRKNISALSNALGSYHLVTDKATNTDRLGQFKFNAYSPIDANANKRLTYGGTVTANTTGLQGSANGFANTYINTSTDFSSNDFTIVFAINTNTIGGVDFGNTDSGGAGLWTNTKNTDNNTYYGAYTGANNKGNIIATRKAIYSYKRSGTTVTLKRNNVTLFTDTNSASARLNYAIYLLSRNFNGTAQIYSSNEYSFFEFINGALTAQQETDFYNALLTRETALSR